MVLYVFQLCGLQLSFWIAGCRGDLSLFARHALRKLLEILKLPEPGGFGGMTWWMEMAYVDAHILDVYIYIWYMRLFVTCKKTYMYMYVYYIHVHKPDIHEIPCHQCGCCNHCPYGLYRFQVFLWTSQVEKLRSGSQLASAMHFNRYDLGQVAYYLISNLVTSHNAGSRCSLADLWQLANQDQAEVCPSRWASSIHLRVEKVRFDYSLLFLWAILILLYLPVEEQLVALFPHPVITI